MTDPRLELIKLKLAEDHRKIDEYEKAMDDRFKRMDARIKNINDLQLAIQELKKPFWKRDRSKIKDLKEFTDLT